MLSKFTVNVFSSHIYILSLVVLKDETLENCFEMVDTFICTKFFFFFTKISSMISVYISSLGELLKELKYLMDEGRI